MNAAAKNLKHLRKQAGLTQEELAERLHVTRQAVSNWETARTQPDIETLTALAEALGTDAGELIYGPRPAASGYVKYQKKYIACAAVCIALLLAWILLEGTLVPYLNRLAGATFDIRLRSCYRFTVEPLACAAAGAALPAAASVWRDIRVRSKLCRRSLLAAGLLFGVSLLLAAALYLLPPAGWAPPGVVQRHLGLVRLILEYPKPIAFLAGLCLFLGLNR